MTHQRSWIWWGIGGAILFLIFVFWRYQFFHTVPVAIEPTAGFQAEDIISTFAGQDTIPAIDDPVFESVSAADTYLRNEGRGLSVTYKGVARFYPYQLLVWHEVVNETFGDLPLLVTYDPLCGAGMVFERSVTRADTIAHEELTFGTTGSVWNNALVLYDKETGAQWIPLLRRAVSDPLGGTELFPYPSTEMTWQQFKDTYPSGRVLSRETGADRDYTKNPYADYETNMDIYYPLTNLDGRLNAKEKVLMVFVGVESKAYPLELLEEAGTLEDTIGALTFTLTSEDDMITTVSEETANLSVFPIYWFCAAAAYPDISLYQY